MDGSQAVTAVSYSIQFVTQVSLESKPLPCECWWIGLSFCQCPVTAMLSKYFQKMSFINGLVS